MKQKQTKPKPKQLSKPKKLSECKHKWIPLLGRIGKKDIPTALYTCLGCGEMKVGEHTIRISRYRLDMGGHPLYAGDVVLGENAGLTLDTALSADGKYCGIVEDGTAGATLAFGELCYFSVTDSRWELAKADVAATGGGVKLGICILAAAADASPTKMMLYGKINAAAKFPDLEVGAPCYMSAATAGLITAGHADATTGQPDGYENTVRIIGYGNTIDELLFCPSRNYISSALNEFTVTAVGTPTGTLQVGSVLTAGARTPSAATVNYQWIRDTSTNIGTNSSTYTLVSADAGHTIKVQVTGTGSYSGTATSSSTGTIAGIYALRDTGPGGGLVFYITDGGLHGLEAAPLAAEITMIVWITGGSTQTTSNGNTVTAVGTGQANANAMMAQSGFTGGAAKVCDDLVYGGKSDWFLPSIGELNLMYTQLKAFGFGGFSGGGYWSSSENNATDGWVIDFWGGSQITCGKGFTNYVRAVRAF